MHRKVKRHAIGIQCEYFCGSIGAIFLQFNPLISTKAVAVITAIDFQ